jgi:triosephosphate isomerase (TIM)
VRKKLVIGNWKMNGSLEKTRLLVEGLRDELQGLDSVGYGICPPFPYLGLAASLKADSALALGAQNLSAQAAGAYTGEVSGAMLKDVGCSFVLVGHSERRSLYGETDEVVVAKLKAALEQGLMPVLCVGETLAEREAQQAELVVGNQLGAAVHGLGVELVQQLVIAYEPVWAIGTGKTASPEEAQAMHAYIRACLQNCGIAAESVSILYGGSVNAANAAGLFAQADIDGALVGGASLEVSGFLAICRAAAQS